jgi:hypothetical protein
LLLALIGGWFFTLGVGLELGQHYQHADGQPVSLRVAEIQGEEMKTLVYEVTSGPYAGRRAGSSLSSSTPTAKLDATLHGYYSPTKGRLRQTGEGPQADTAGENTRGVSNLRQQPYPLRAILGPRC